MTLLKRLQDHRDWVAQTKGQKHAYTKLTLGELEQIIASLAPRKLDPMQPAGTRRSVEEIRKLIAKYS